MHVSNVSIAIIVFNMALGLLFPIVLMLVVKRKYQLGVKPFFLGCLTMFLFALVLEQIVHAIVLGSPAGSAIQNNFWLMALYGGLMAGLFEETGRVMVEPAPIPSSDGAVECLLEQDVSTVRIGVEVGIVEACGNAVIGDRLKHVGVIVPSAFPRFGECELSADRGGVVMAYPICAIAHELGVILPHGGAIEFGGLLGRAGSGQRAGKSDTGLCVCNGIASRIVALGQSEGVEEIEFADEVQGGCLPACGFQRGGIACILGFILCEDDMVDIGKPESGNAKNDNRDEDEEQNLSVPLLASEWVMGWIGYHGRDPSK